MDKRDRVVAADALRRFTTDVFARGGMIEVDAAVVYHGARAPGVSTTPISIALPARRHFAPAERGQGAQQSRRSARRDDVRRLS